MKTGTNSYSRMSSLLLASAALLVATHASAVSMHRPTESWNLRAGHGDERMKKGSLYYMNDAYWKDEATRVNDRSAELRRQQVEADEEYARQVAAAQEFEQYMQQFVANQGGMATDLVHHVYSLYTEGRRTLAELRDAYTSWKVQMTVNERKNFLTLFANAGLDTRGW